MAGRGSKRPLRSPNNVDSKAKSSNGIGSKNCKSAKFLATKKLLTKVKIAKGRRSKQQKNVASRAASPSDENCLKNAPTTEKARSKKSEVTPKESEVRDVGGTVSRRALRKIQSKQGALNPDCGKVSDSVHISSCVQEKTCISVKVPVPNGTVRVQLNEHQDCETMSVTSQSSSVLSTPDKNPRRSMRRNQDENADSAKDTGNRKALSSLKTSVNKNVKYKKIAQSDVGNGSVGSKQHVSNSTTKSKDQKSFILKNDLKSLDLEGSVIYSNRTRQCSSSPSNTKVDIAKSSKTKGETARPVLKLDSQSPTGYSLEMRTVLDNRKETMEVTDKQSKQNRKLTDSKQRKGVKLSKMDALFSDGEVSSDASVEVHTTVQDKNGKRKRSIGDYGSRKKSARLEVNLNTCAGITNCINETQVKSGKKITLAEYCKRKSTMNIKSVEPAESDLIVSDNSEGRSTRTTHSKMGKIGNKDGKEPKNGDKTENTPKIDYKTEKEPKNGNKSKKGSKIGDRADKELRICDKAEKAPKNGDKALRTPKSRDKVEKEPQIYDKSEKECKNSDKAEKRSKNGDMAEKGPKNGDEAEKEPQNSDKAEKGPKIGDKAVKESKYCKDEKGPRIGDKAGKSPKIGDKAEKNSKKGDKAEKEPKNCDKAEKGPKNGDKAKKGPKIGDNGEKDLEIGDKTEIASKLVDKAGKTQEIGDKAEKATKNGDKLEKEPKACDKAEKDPKNSDKAEKEPENSDKAEKGPKNGDEAKKGPKIGDMAEKELEIGIIAEKEPINGDKVENKTKIGDKAKKGPKIDKAEKEPKEPNDKSENISVSFSKQNKISSDSDKQVTKVVSENSCSKDAPLIPAEAQKISSIKTSQDNSAKPQTVNSKETPRGNSVGSAKKESLKNIEFKGSSPLVSKKAPITLARREVVLNRQDANKAPDATKSSNAELKGRSESSTDSPKVTNEAKASARKIVYDVNVGASTSSSVKPADGFDKSCSNSLSIDKKLDEHLTAIPISEPDENEPWVSDATKTEIVKRNSAYSLYKRTNNERIGKFYERLRKKVRDMINEDKLQSFNRKRKEDTLATIGPAGKKVKDVVLVFDKQDEYLVNTLKEEYPNIQCIYKKNLAYHTARRAVYSNGSLGTNPNDTLYVMMCGVLTALKFDPNPRCKQSGCSSAFRNFKLFDTSPESLCAHLINQAILVRKNLEKCGDNVIFTELFPIHLISVELDEIRAHLKLTEHQIPPTSHSVLHGQQEVLEKALILFNDWVYQDTMEQNMSHWSMVGHLLKYSSGGKLLFEHAFTQDGRRLGRKSFLVRKKAVVEAYAKTCRWIPLFDDVRLQDSEKTESSSTSSVPHVGVEEEIVFNSDGSSHTPQPAQVSSEDGYQIVLICDEQDSYLRGFQKPNVTVRYIKNFDLSVGYASIFPWSSPAIHTLFVVLCGVRTILTKEVELECRQMGCKPYLYRLQPSSTDSSSLMKKLIAGAIRFRQKILALSPNYQVIFSGLLPPSLYHMDKYAVDAHYTSCSHKAPLHSKEYFTKMSTVLQNALLRYNAWAREDSTARGFHGWDLESIFTMDCEGQEAFYHILEADGQTLSIVGQQERTSVLQEVLEYTFGVAPLPTLKPSNESQSAVFTPEQITLIFDEQEKYLTSVNSGKVSCVDLSPRLLRFQNVDAEIKSIKFSDAKRLFVVYGGIDTVLDYCDDVICKAIQCWPSMRWVKLRSETSHGLHNMLVLSAITARQRIQSNNPNHRVIFTPLVPVDLMAIDRFNQIEHKTQCLHSPSDQYRKVHENDAHSLIVAIRHFNEWAKKDAESQGFPDWNTDELFFATELNSEVMFLPELLPNGSVLTKKWQEIKINSVTASIQKTWDSIQQKKEDAERVSEAIKSEREKKQLLHQKAKKSGNKDDWDAFRNQKRKVISMLREAKLGYFAPRPEEKDPSASCPLKSKDSSPNADSVDSNSEATNSIPGPKSSEKAEEKYPFEHIYIICNSLYGHIFRGFSSPNVTFIVEEQFMFDSIPKVIQENRRKDRKKVLWLFPTGIYSLIEFYKHHDCSNCPEPLHVMGFGNQCVPTEDNMKEVSKNYLKLGEDMENSVRKILQPNEAILFAPPIRALVVAYEYFPHAMLHQVCGANGAFCTDAQTLNALKAFYNIFCEHWKSLVSEDKKWPFPIPSLASFREYYSENQGQHVVPVGDQEDYKFAIDTWTDMLRTFIKKSTGVDLSINSSPSLEPPANLPHVVAEQGVNPSLLGTPNCFPQAVNPSIHGTPNCVPYLPQQAVNPSLLGTPNCVPYLPQQAVNPSFLGTPSNLPHVAAGQAIRQSLLVTPGNLPHVAAGQAIRPLPLGTPSNLPLVAAGQAIRPLPLGTPSNLPLVAAGQAIRPLPLGTLGNPPHLAQQAVYPSPQPPDNLPLNVYEEDVPLNVYDEAEVQGGDDLRSIVFVGDEQQVKDFQKFKEKFNIRFINENLDYSGDCINRMVLHQQKIKGPAIWLLLTSFTQITERVSTDTHCTRVDCPDSLEFREMEGGLGKKVGTESRMKRLVRDEIARAEDFAMRLVKKFHHKSIICFMPVLPMSVILTSKAVHHNLLHKLKRADPSLQLLYGIYSCWYKCANYFDNRWTNFLMEHSLPEISAIFESYNRINIFKCVNFVYSYSSLKGNSKILIGWTNMISQVLEALRGMFHIRDDSNEMDQATPDVQTTGQSSSPSDAVIPCQTTPRQSPDSVVESSQEDDVIIIDPPTSDTVVKKEPVASVRMSLETVKVENQGKKTSNVKDLRSKATGSQQSKTASAQLPVSFETIKVENQGKTTSNVKDLISEATGSHQSKTTSAIKDSLSKVTCSPKKVAGAASACIQEGPTSASVSEEPSNSVTKDTSSSKVSLPKISNENAALIVDDSLDDSPIVSTAKRNTAKDPRTVLVSSTNDAVCTDKALPVTKKDKSLVSNTAKKSDASAKGTSSSGTKSSEAVDEELSISSSKRASNSGTQSSETAEKVLSITESPSKKGSEWKRVANKSIDSSVVNTTADSERESILFGGQQLSGTPGKYEAVSSTKKKSDAFSSTQDKSATESSTKKSGALSSSKEKSDTPSSTKQKSDVSSNAKQKSDALSSSQKKSDGLSNTQEESDASSNAKKKSDAMSNNQEMSDALSNTQKKSDKVSSTQDESDALLSTKKKLDVLSGTQDAVTNTQDKPNKGLSSQEESDALSDAKKSDALSNTLKKSDAVSNTQEKSNKVTSIQGKSDALSNARKKSDALSSTQEKSGALSSTQEKSDAAVSRTNEKSDVLPSTKTKTDALFNIENKSEKADSKRKSDASTDTKKKSDALADTKEKSEKKSDELSDTKKNSDALTDGKKKSVKNSDDLSSAKKKSEKKSDALSNTKKKSETSDSKKKSGKNSDSGASSDSKKKSEKKSDADTKSKSEISDALSNKKSDALSDTKKKPEKKSDASTDNKITSDASTDTRKKSEKDSDALTDCKKKPEKSDVSIDSKTKSGASADTKKKLEKDSDALTDSKKNSNVSTDNKKKPEKKSDASTESKKKPEKSDVSTDPKKKSDLSTDTKKKSEKNSDASIDTKMKSDALTDTKQKSDALTDTKKKSNVSTDAKKKSDVSTDAKKKSDASTDAKKKSEKSSDAQTDIKMISDALKDSRKKTERKSDILTDTRKKSDVLSDTKSKSEKKSDALSGTRNKSEKGKKSDELSDTKKKSEKKSDTRRKSVLNDDEAFVDKDNDGKIDSAFKKVSVNCQSTDVEQGNIELELGAAEEVTSNSKSKSNSSVEKDITDTVSVISALSEIATSSSPEISSNFEKQSSSQAGSLLSAENFLSSPGKRAIVNAMEKSLKSSVPYNSLPVKISYAEERWGSSPELTLRLSDHLSDSDSDDSLPDLGRKIVCRSEIIASDSGEKCGTVIGKTHNSTIEASVPSADIDPSSKYDDTELGKKSGEILMPNNAVIEPSHTAGKEGSSVKNSSERESSVTSVADASSSQNPSSFSMAKNTMNCLSRLLSSSSQTSGIALPTSAVVKTKANSTLVSNKTQVGTISVNEDKAKEDAAISGHCPPSDTPVSANVSCVAASSKGEASTCVQDDLSTVEQELQTCKSTSADLPNPDESLAPQPRSAAPTCIVHPMHPTLLSVRKDLISTSESSANENSSNSRSGKLKACQTTTVQLSCANTVTNFSVTSVDTSTAVGQASLPQQLNATQRINLSTNSTKSVLPLQVVSTSSEIPTAIVNPSKVQELSAQISKNPKGKDGSSSVSSDGSNAPESVFGIVLLNVSTSLKDKHLEMLLKACGPVISVGRPTNFLGKPAENLWVKFSSRAGAMNAIRIFSELKIAGNLVEVRNLGNNSMTDEWKEIKFSREIYKSMKRISLDCNVPISLRGNLAPMDLKLYKEILSEAQQKSVETEKPNEEEVPEETEEYLSFSLSSADELPDLQPQKKKRRKKEDIPRGKGKKLESSKHLESSRIETSSQGGSPSKKQPERRNDVSLNTGSPLKNQNKKNEQTSSRSDVKGDGVLVKVCNLGRMMPPEIVKDLFSVFEGVEAEESCTSDNSSERVFRFSTSMEALLAESELNNLRLLDTILDVKLCSNKKGDRSALSDKNELMFHNSILKVLAEYEETVITIARAVAESGLNFFSFKTEPCTRVDCSTPELCRDYHSSADKRRSPLLHCYNVSMCSMMQSHGICNRKEDCEDAHSPMESLFHLEKFRHHACIGWYHNRCCPRGDMICPFAHPESPDMFFHQDWKDLYLEGLHNSLFYLSGAILNLYKFGVFDTASTSENSNVHPSIARIQIMVLTSSVHMAKLYTECVKELSLLCNQDVAFVTLNAEIPGSSIIIGTPSSLSRMLNMGKKKTAKDKVSWDVNNIKAIIVDDVSSLLKEFKDSSLHYSLKKIMSTRGINKVAVCDKIDVIEIHKISRLLSTKFLELPLKKQSKNNVSQISKDAYEAIPKELLRKQTLADANLQSGNSTPVKAPTLPLSGIPEANIPLSPISDAETVVYSSTIDKENQALDGEDSEVSISSVDTVNFHEESRNSTRKRPRSTSRKCERFRSIEGHQSLQSSGEPSHQSSSVLAESEPPHKKYRDTLTKERLPELSSKRRRESSPSSSSKLKRRKSLSSKSSGDGSRHSSPSKDLRKRHKRSLSRSERHSREYSSSRRGSHSSDRSPERSSRRSKRSPSRERRKHKNQKKHKCRKHSHREERSSRRKRGSTSPPTLSSDAPLHLESNNDCITSAVPVLLTGQSKKESVDMINLDSTAESERSHCGSKRKVVAPDLPKVTQHSLLDHSKKRECDIEIVLDVSSSCPSSLTSKVDSSCPSLLGSKLDIDSTVQSKGKHSATSLPKESKGTSLSSKLGIDLPIQSQEKHTTTKSPLPKENKRMSFSDGQLWEKVTSHQAQETEVPRRLSQIKERPSLFREEPLFPCADLVIPLNFPSKPAPLPSKDIMNKEVPAAPNKYCAPSPTKEFGRKEVPAAPNKYCAPSPTKEFGRKEVPAAPCQKCKGKFDPLTDERFLALEKSVKESHEENYRLYLSTPEIHAEYATTFSSFEEMYEQRFGSGEPPEHRVEVWEGLWEAFIREEENEEWEKKRVNILKQYEEDLLKENKCHCSRLSLSIGSGEIYSSTSKGFLSVGSGEIYNSASKGLKEKSPETIDLSDDSDSPEILIEDVSPRFETPIEPVASTSKAVPSTDRSYAEFAEKNRQNPTSDFSLADSLRVLNEVCDSLGFIGTLMRAFIVRVRGFDNTREAFIYLGEADTIKFLQMAAEKVTEATGEASGVYKSKLLYCDRIIKNLMDYATECFSKAQLFDINKLAKATLNKETSVIVDMIKNFLKSHGIKEPSHGIIRKVYSKIMSLHLKAALND